MKFFFLILVTALILFACKKDIKNDALTNDFSNTTIYYNGEIITMEGSQVAYAEVVVENEGKII